MPVSAELVRLYADYLQGEYGDLDCDYVFVNLWGQPHGYPLAYPAVYDLVRRLRRRTGIGFDPHWCRHTGATSLRDGVPIEVVSKLLGHADLTTTSSVYGHLTVEDTRKALEQRAGPPVGRCGYDLTNPDHQREAVLRTAANPPPGAGSLPGQPLGAGVRPGRLEAWQAGHR